MSIVRIDSPSTHGYQARAFLAKGQELSKLCSDSKHGGPVGALAAALQAEAQLKRRAARLRRAGYR